MDSVRQGLQSLVPVASSRCGAMPNVCRELWSTCPPLQGLPLVIGQFHYPIHAWLRPFGAQMAVAVVTG
jgi:hypothetical protein